MRILIIRHGDPDYEKDSLTQKGWHEAELLADKMEKTDVTAFYVSPLGRAQDTASVTLKRLGRSAKTYHWLREFHAPIYDKKTKKLRGPWDLMPSFFTKEDDLYDVKKWADTEFMKQGRVKQEYRKVSQGLDKVLKTHGYERKDKYYKAVNANKDTIVFFCHFGVECVMLSHLLNISPVCLWQGFCAAPTSVTTLYTDFSSVRRERRARICRAVLRNLRRYVAKALIKAIKWGCKNFLFLQPRFILYFILTYLSLSIII